MSDDALERYITRTEIGSWSILAGVGGLAILLGLFAPQHPATVPGWAYALLPVIMPIWGAVRGRRLKRMMR